MNNLIIAIDGPAASGKGTLSRRLAEKFGLPHLDTGLTYRAVGHVLLETKSSLDDETIALAAARSIDLGALDRTTLARHHIGEAASKIAVMPTVRQILVEMQREFASKPPGAVLDGRDIGTVVCPNATVKLYVTASSDVRAYRRYQEILARGHEADLPTILDDIKLRDERDMGRKDSPLKPAEDAHLIDTSKMSIEAAFQEALNVINATLAT